METVVSISDSTGIFMSAIEKNDGGTALLALRYRACAH